MQGVRLPVVCLVVVVFPTAHQYEETVTEEHLTFNPDDITVSETIKYIPLGHHASLKCEAAERTSKIHTRAANASWRLLHKHDGRVDTYELEYNRSLHSSRIMIYDNTAYVHGMSRLLDGSTIVCSVVESPLLPLKTSPTAVDTAISTDDKAVQTDPEQNDQSPVSLRSFSSRITLVAQNCGKATEEGATSINKLNPCRYGSCRIKMESGYEMLECRCLSQYTGMFCDQLADGATMKERPMALEKHLPRGYSSVDLRKNFPTMFLTPGQKAPAKEEQEGGSKPGTAPSSRKDDEEKKAGPGNSLKGTPPDEK
ncbi:hypothetical protein Q1695_012515 [Nippostrongylus brasiliensis]|nr:hypothetical protein Q1695_012515 [Nippostrongylus brasiliensis]